MSYVVRCAACGVRMGGDSPDGRVGSGVDPVATGRGFAACAVRHAAHTVRRAGKRRENGHETAFWHGIGPRSGRDRPVDLRDLGFRRGLAAKGGRQGRDPCQNAVPWPFSRHFPARRAVCATCRTAHAMRHPALSQPQSPLPTPPERPLPKPQCPPPAIILTACGSAATTPSQFSRAAFSLPGRLITRWRPRCMHTARESIA